MNWQLLKKSWPLFILGILLLGSLVYNFIQNNEISEKNAKIYFQDSLLVLDSTKYKQVVEELQSEKQATNYLKTQNQGLADLVKEAKEEIKAITQIALKFKNQSVIRIDTTQPKFIVLRDTIQVPIGKDSVDIDENYADVVQIKGKTWLHPNKGYKLDFESKPINLDLVLTQDKNGIWQYYVDTHNPQLEVFKIKAKILTKEAENNFWSDIHGIVSGNFTNHNSFIDLGFSYKKIGIKGIVGYTYQQINDVFYGGGVSYILF